MRLIGGDELRGRLSMHGAIDALETAFRDLDPGGGPLRSHVETTDGSLLLMPAEGAPGVGVKLVTLTPSNPERGKAFINAVYVLFAPGTQEPEAVIDGAALTALRTAAVSGLATRYLAREDASRLVVFGAGVQARAHVEAMRAVRPIERVTIVSRSRSGAGRLAEEVGAELGEPAAAGEADLICTCTTSPTPVLEDRWVREGAHLNAVGAYLPTTRELEGSTVGRARVAVEARDAAAAEAGDLLIPIAQGVIGPDHVLADLKELVRGAPVRRTPGDITAFVSVGMAFEDLVVARAAVDAP